MPSAERYAQYRADKTTIWVSKRAAETLGREREPGEATAATVDRLITELRALRRAGGGGAAGGATAKKTAAKKGAAKKATATKATAKRAAGARGG